MLVFELANREKKSYAYLSRKFKVERHLTEKVCRELGKHYECDEDGVKMIL